LLLLLLGLLLLHTFRRHCQLSWLGFCGIAFKLIVLHILWQLLPQVFRMLLKLPNYAETLSFRFFRYFFWAVAVVICGYALKAALDFYRTAKHFNFKGQPFSGRLLPLCAVCICHVYVPMMTIAFLFWPLLRFWLLLCLWPVSFPFSFLEVLFFFVLHVVVGFSPLVYNFNKILLTNSGDGRRRRWQGSIRQLYSYFLSMPIFIPSVRMPNRYYYYNNSGGSRGSRGSSSGNNNCSNCLSALYLSILQLTLLALHTFKALWQFFLSAPGRRPGRGRRRWRRRSEGCGRGKRRGLRLFVCHLRPTPNSNPYSCYSPAVSQTSPLWAKLKARSSILNGAAVFFLSNGGISVS